jgi:hypothetical protein
MSLQLLKVLQISVVLDGSTNIPMPVGSGVSGPARPTWLKLTTMPVLLETNTPTSFPGWVGSLVMVFLVMVTFCAARMKTAVASPG